MLRHIWAAGAVLAFSATAALAAPFPVVTIDAVRAPVEPVQYYYPYGPYYAPPPPPPVYYGRPRRAPVYGYPAPGPYRYYDKEAAKDYVKSQREMQKEILKDRTRAWNRAHGF